MIIEFFGLPATGKTTTALKLQDGLKYKIIKVNNNYELLLYNFIFFIKHPIFCMVTIYHIVNNSSSYKIFYYKLMNCYFQNNAKYEKAKKEKNSIIDQGHWQNLLSIFEKKIHVQIIKKYIKLIPKLDKIVMFNLDKEDWATAISNRGYFSREDMVFDNEVWKKTIKKNNDILFDFLQKDFNSKITFFNSSKDNLSILDE